MIDTIQELEKEIALFRKNIKDSNELMQVILSFVAITKEQTEVFEARSKKITDEITRLPPELSEIAKSKVEQFRLDIQQDYKTHQEALKGVLDGFILKLGQTEKAICAIPATVDEQTERASRSLVTEIGRLNHEHAQELIRANETFQEDSKNHREAVQRSLDGFAEKLGEAEKAITAIPATVDEQTGHANESLVTEIGRLNHEHAQELKRANEAFQQDSKEHREAVQVLLDGFAKKLGEAEKAITAIPATIDEQTNITKKAYLNEISRLNLEYSQELTKINDAFVKKLQTLSDALMDIPELIKKNHATQSETFISDLSRIIGDHTDKMVQIDKHITELSEKLETKYDAFVARLEATNMDQLYKYCQDMNRSLSIKLGIALGGVGMAIVISIISLFI